MTATEPVVLKDIRGSAIRIVIRLGLGEYRLRGPDDNVMELESRVAWATVATELENEGYAMVPPGEFAAAYALAPEAVRAMIHEAGTLFSLVYASAGETCALVPLAEWERRGGIGPVPE